MMSLGSFTFEGSTGSVKSRPPSSQPKTRFRLFSLRPIIQYTCTRYLPLLSLPRISPRPGYGFAFSASRLVFAITSSEVFILLVLSRQQCHSSYCLSSPLLSNEKRTERVVSPYAFFQCLYYSP